MVKNKIAQIIPLLKLKRLLDLFDYEIPAELAGLIKIGQLVQINFHGKNTNGIVRKIIDQPQNLTYKLKSISKVVADFPVLSKSQIGLIEFVAEKYFIAQSFSAKTILPELPKRQIKPKKTKYQFISFKDNNNYSLIIKNLFNQDKPALIQYFDQNKKFQLYQQIIKKNIASGKQTLIIFPEILEAKKFCQYLSEFEGQFVLYLDSLSKGQKYLEYLNIFSAEKKIIIGTRSAIFAPINQGSTIIIDDEDNENHKQEEPNPRYQTKEIALFLKDINKIKIIYSAQSPSIETLYQVNIKNFYYVKLDQLEHLPEIQIIDRNDEAKKGNYNVLSEELRRRISVYAAQKRQIFLFLNRRGYNSLIQCDDCQHIVKCPKCNLPLSVHKQNLLICHHCDYHASSILVCPACRSTNLKFKGTGTEKLLNEVSKYFSQYQVVKYDLEDQDKGIDLQNADIIIGTRFALPYLNFEKIGLVGIVSADNLLYLPDYNSSEKLFNQISKLICQLAHPGKELIIQTFDPQNFVFQNLRTLNLKDFYRQEIATRQTFKYPPFVSLIKIIYKHKNSDEGFRNIKRIYEQLKPNLSTNDFVIFPPTPSYLSVLRNLYQFQLIIKVLNPNASLEPIKNVDEIFIIDNNPLHIM